MDRWKKFDLIAVSIVIMLFFCNGCGPKSKKRPKELAPKIELGTKIGDLAEVLAIDAILVKGYSLVGGLNGTGSPQCRLDIRGYLAKYIQRKLPGYDVDALINSNDTAVVEVQGLMPMVAIKDHSFDVRVVALGGTQTTSLKGGTLWEAELKEVRNYEGTLRILATAQGPVFLNTVGRKKPNEKVGYILGGGKVLDEYKITISLRKPDYRTASIIRNRLNERFGIGTVKGASPGQMQVKVPAEYAKQKQRFVAVVKNLYLTHNPAITKERISAFVRDLAVSENKFSSETALEAIGNESLGKLSILLNSSDEALRLLAARCMLNMGGDMGVEALRATALDKKSSYRIAAMEILTASARHNDAVAVARRLLWDEDLNIRLAAYESLLELEDIVIARKLIGGNFYLDRIAVVQSQSKGIFVSRSGQPRIALFSVPIRCRDDIGIYIQSEDGTIIINAPAGQEYVTVMRKHPKLKNIPPVQMQCDFELADIIQTLCEETVVEEGEIVQLGLGVPYDQMIALLKQMTEKGVVEAEFRVGSMPRIP